MASTKEFLVRWSAWRPYSWGSALPKLGASIVAIVSIAIVATLILGRSAPENDPGATAPKQRKVADSLLFGNEIGDYSFRYPAGWDVSREGSITHVRSPNEAAVASFGVDDASGDVLNSFFRLQDMLLARYSSVSFERPRTASWSAGTTIVGRGRLVNSGGTPLRFLAASVEGTVHNYVLIAFEEVGKTAGRPLDSLRRIMASFEESSSI